MDIEYSDITLTCLIYRDPFLYNFLTNNQFLIIFHKSLCTTLLHFYMPKYIKLDYSNIFYKNTSQGHNPAFFLLMVSKKGRLLMYLKGGPHDGVSKAQ